MCSQRHYLYKQRQANRRDNLWHHQPIPKGGRPSMFAPIKSRALVHRKQPPLGPRRHLRRRSLSDTNPKRPSHHGLTEKFHHQPPTILPNRKYRRGPPRHGRKSLSQPEDHRLVKHSWPGRHPSAPPRLNPTATPEYCPACQLHSSLLRNLQHKPPNLRLLCASSSPFQLISPRADSTRP